MNWFKKFHKWVLQWANTKWSVWSLFLCAFADASFLPLPTPMFFIALIILNREKAYKYTLFGTLGTVSGGIAGYCVGHFAWLNETDNFTRLAQLAFEYIPGFSEILYFKIQSLYIKWDFWILFIASSLPLPYKIFSISSGVFNINILVFGIATFISQGIKFSLIAFLTIKTGDHIKKLLVHNWKLVTVIATSSLILILTAIKIF